MLLSFVKDGLRNRAILRKLRLVNLPCSSSMESSITFGSTSLVPSSCFSEASSALYLVFIWPCESLSSFYLIDTYIMFVARMVSVLKHEYRLLRSYLIDFETVGIYYLMFTTFAGIFGSNSFLSRN